MKNVFFAMFLVLSTMFSYSCESSKKELQKTIETANKECPIDLGMIGEMSSMRFDEEADEVIITMTIRKDFPLKISALQNLKNTLKRAMLGNWARTESSIKLMKDIAKANSRFTMVMQTEVTNENIEINISKDEVKDLAEGNIDPILPRDLLEIMAVSANAQCPMQVDEATTLSSASLEGSNFVYNYSLDENSVSIEALKQNKTVLKANIKQTLFAPDPIVKQMVDLCKEANIGLLYRYVGEVSGNVCVVKFAPSEL